MNERSDFASYSISSRRFLTISPMLTMPQSRPFRTTGKWRMRRLVISAISSSMLWVGSQVMTGRVITSATVSDKRPEPWVARAWTMSRSEMMPSTLSPSSLATRAPILRETSASTAAPTVSSGRMVATARPLLCRIVSTFIRASQPFAVTPATAPAYQHRTKCRSRELISAKHGWRGHDNPSGQKTGTDMERIQIGEVSIEVRTAGEDRPLLFLHGGDYFAQNRDFLARLGRRWRVIIPRHPGFGGSQRPDGFRTVHDLAYLYLDLLEQQHLNDVVLVGSSFGGWIALEMCVRSVERIGRLALIDTLGVKFGGREQRDIADIYALPADEVVRRT